MKVTSNTILHNSFTIKAESLISISKEKHLKTKKYLNNNKLFNKVTGEFTNINYDREWTANQSYLFKTFVMDDVRYQADTLKLTPIFITTTLPSEYHPYNTDNNGVKHFNRKYKGCSVKDGVERLTAFSRALINNFKVDRKRTITKFVRVVEPHKSMVAHNHMIVWVKDEEVANFEHHYNNTIALFGFNYKGQDFKVLNNKETKGTTTYLLKYVNKTLEGGNDFIEGWLTANEIKKVMTNSRASLSRRIFKRVSGEIPFNPRDEKPYLLQVKEHLIIDSTIVDSNGKELVNTVTVGSKALYQVIQVQERNQSLVDVIESDNEDKDYYVYESTYRLKSLIITKLIDGEVIYDKDDICPLEEFEEDLIMSEIISHDGGIDICKYDEIETVYYM